MDKTMKLLVTMYRDEDGWCVAECPMIPGCMSQGRTEVQALENIREAM
jgi:predicted RNase H-like HicB family nuclease